MAQYIVQHDYRSGTAGPWEAGDVVDLEPALAEWVNRDSPGTLIAARAPEAPPQDRMVRQSRRRDRTGDPGDQGAIDRRTFRAVKGG